MDALASELSKNAAFRAVLLCAVTTLAAFSLHLLFGMTFSAYLFLLFGVLMGHWALRRGAPTVDPAATFVTFLTCLFSSHWILATFFIAPNLGPFAPTGEFWTVTNVLNTVAFGFVTPFLLGATLGLTYVAARTTTRTISWTRGLTLLLFMSVPLYFIRELELVTRFLSGVQ